ncbi:MAG: lytic transglycosylase domain-containing protein [Acidobacteria bacterium]|nr:lytic transglycosylase domain-containing protein [Acidobacteriota bacterium]MCB9396817.1 lytic transglycosylase domain-containing protein [Acidobacteriota bacterium]
MIRKILPPAGFTFFCFFILCSCHHLELQPQATPETQLQAQESEEQINTPEPEPEPPRWNLLDAIDQGRTLLAQSPLLGYREEEKVSFTKRRDGKYYRDKKLSLIEREIALAVLDRHSGEVFELRYWVNQDEMDEASRLRRSYQNHALNLPNFRPDLPNNPFEVAVRWWNHHNSDLWVMDCHDPDPHRYIVVANKYLMVSDQLAYREDRTGGRYSEIIYVPYSKDLHDRALIEKGRQFLNEKVHQAFRDLRERQVFSEAFPGVPVVDTISETFMKNIFLTEQTDPKWILEAEDGGLYLTERVFARLGANGADTFRYTFSKTGALGLAQIMPGTYRLVAKRYGSADLFPEENIGRIDIVNAVKASVLVFDDHLSTVINRAQRKSKTWAVFQAKDMESINEIRAAIYNGGPGKYMPETGGISQKVKETREFVIKFGMIRDLNHFEG